MIRLEDEMNMIIDLFGREKGVSFLYRNIEKYLYFNALINDSAQIDAEKSEKIMMYAISMVWKEAI